MGDKFAQLSTQLSLGASEGTSINSFLVRTGLRGAPRDW